MSDIKNPKLIAFCRAAGAGDLDTVAKLSMDPFVATYAHISENYAIRFACIKKRQEVVDYLVTIPMIKNNLGGKTNTFLTFLIEKKLGRMIPMFLHIKSVRTASFADPIIKAVEMEDCESLAILLASNKTKKDISLNEVVTIAIGKRKFNVLKIVYINNPEFRASIEVQLTEARLMTEPEIVAMIEGAPKATPEEMKEYYLQKMKGILFPADRIDTCGICWEECSTVTKCNHAFCPSCLGSSFLQSKACPMCLKELQGKSKYSRED